jgi:hypothetical protein
MKKQIKVILSAAIIIAVVVIIALIYREKFIYGEKANESNLKKSPGTITFTTKDPEKGILSGTFENDGYTIRFDVARREANPAIMVLLSKNTPHYAIDVRICDERQFCFAQRAGGDAFADPNWHEDDSEKNIPDDQRATKNHETMKLLHRKLVELGPNDFTGLTEEYQALVSLSDEPPDS